MPGHGPQYESTGNVLFDRLFQAELHFAAADTDMDGACAQVADAIRRRGGKPYYIPGGGSNPVGALGYVDAPLELLTQANGMGLRIDCVVHGTGSTGTQSGLVCGLEGASSGIDVLGICVRRPAAAQIDTVYETASATAAHVGIKGELERGRVVANGDYVGPGYGIPTAGTIEAIRLAAAHEGLLLDPVYSGKAMAGLIDLCRKRFFTQDQRVVFLHTGGATALFAYESDFAATR